MTAPAGDSETEPDRPLRIGHFCPQFFPSIGGAEIAAHNIATNQVRAGHDVTMVVNWDAWKHSRGLTPYPIRPIAPRSISASLRATPLGLHWIPAGAQLAAYQMRYRFDVWEVHMAYPGGHVAVDALNRIRVPVVVTCQGVDIQTLADIHYGHRLDAERETAIGAALRGADAAVAISHDIADEMRELGVAEERIHHIPNGAPVPRIRNHRIDRDEVRRRLDWPPGVMVVVTVGRNHPKKGFSIIPEVVQRAAEADAGDFLWVMIGRGNEPLAAEAERRGVSNRLRVVGELAPTGSGESSMFDLPSDSLLEAYLAADIFGFPTRLEGSPLVLFEAMASGLVPLATTAPGVAEFLEQGRDSLLSPVGDAEAMARNLVRLSREPDLRRSLSAAASERAERHSWGRLADEHVRLYRTLL